MRYPSNSAVEADSPGILETLAGDFVHGVPDEGVFAVIEKFGGHLPPGTLLYIGHGLPGDVWWAEVTGEWLYSDFGDVCCPAHRPDGPDHGVYEYIPGKGPGRRVR